MEMEVSSRLEASGCDECLQMESREPWKPVEEMATISYLQGDEHGKTRYTARVRHWTVADREAHEQMGFLQGWGLCE